MRSEYSAEAFDETASGYDRMLHEWDGFPFADYSAVLDAVVQETGARRGMRVLDLGIGTGNLAGLIAVCECEVWGIDFSEKMLAEARVKVPGVRLIRADLLDDWPGIDGRFHRVVSSFVFHHFDFAAKIDLLQKIARDYSTADGRIVVADIAFATQEARTEGSQRFGPNWDKDEYYWVADETIDALSRLGFACRYKQVSVCGGVFTIAPGTLDA